MSNNKKRAIRDRSGSEATSPQEHGYVVIRLAGPTMDSMDLGEVAKSNHLNSLKAFLDSNPKLKAERIISDPPELIRRLEQQVERSAFAPFHSLADYWRIVVPNKVDAERVRRNLQKMSEVSIAYHEAPVQLACNGFVSSPLANPFFVEQDYLKAKPTGVGARAAWSRHRVFGCGVSVFDLEAGWTLDHEDLPNPQLLFGHNHNDDWSRDHGTAVLGVIGAVHNNIGVIGIAPGVDSLNAVSHYDPIRQRQMHVARAIFAALKHLKTGHLKTGDVLLLEVERDHYDGTALPTETDSADFDAIRLASAHGIVVIEAAGNSDPNGLNLDNWIDPISHSGAIMVGAARSSVLEENGQQGHRRFYRSNYGSRVNVYAWGERIYTTGWGGDLDSLQGSPGSDNSYRKNFGQTSGASAIIAGAAALVQSWYKEHRGEPLSPARMREVLSNPETATPQVWVNGDPIGVMPDVSKVIGRLKSRRGQIVGG